MEIKIPINSYIHCISNHNSVRPYLLKVTYIEVTDNDTIYHCVSRNEKYISKLSKRYITVDEKGGYTCNFRTNN